MSVLLGRDTRVLIQGLGREGSFHAARMKDYGTAVVGATKPGKGGTRGAVSPFQGSSFLRVP